MKFIIGCDADGVLTDLSSHNLREGKKVFAREAINPCAYSLEEMFDLSDISKFILYSKAFKIFINYCKNEPPREGAKEVIEELSNEDYEFHSITARKFATNKNQLGSLARKWFKEWLKKYNINFSSIQFCSEDKSPEDKLMSCKKLGVNVMIDDKPDVALHLANNGIKVIMFNAPYNLNIVHENIIRVNNWQDVKNVLKELKNEKDLKGDKTFLKQEKEVIDTYTDEEKKEYFDLYKKHLKSLYVDEELFKRGDRKFKLIYSMLKYPVKAFYKVKVIGKENVPYQNGFILASNHTDSTDQYRLGLALGNRPFIGFAAKEIENSFRGRLFKSTGLGIFVDRSNPNSRKESSVLMAKYVSHDRIALIFPEGTRKNKDEEGKKRFQNRFKLGTVAIAQKTGAAILPVATNIFGRDTIVRFGQLIYVEPTDDLEEVNKKLELIIANLSLENIRYYYTKKNKLDSLTIEEKKYQEYVKEVEALDFHEEKNKEKKIV